MWGRRFFLQFLVVGCSLRQVLGKIPVPAVGGGRVLCLGLLAAGVISGQFGCLFQAFV